MSLFFSCPSFSWLILSMVTTITIISNNRTYRLNNKSTIKEINIIHSSHCNIRFLKEVRLRVWAFLALQSFLDNNLRFPSKDCQDISPSMEWWHSLEPLRPSTKTSWPLTTSSALDAETQDSLDAWRGNVTTDVIGDVMMAMEHLGMKPFASLWQGLDKHFFIAFCHGVTLICVIPVLLPCNCRFILSFSIVRTPNVNENKTFSA